MNEIEFVGMFISVMVPTLVSLIALVKYFVKPLMELNTTMVELKDSIKSLNSEEKRQDKRLDEHECEIDKLKDKVTRHDVDIENLKNERK